MASDDLVPETKVLAIASHVRCPKAAVNLAAGQW